MYAVLMFVIYKLYDKNFGFSLKLTETLYALRPLYSRDIHLYMSIWSRQVWTTQATELCVLCEEPPALLLGPAKILPPASERRKNKFKKRHIFLVVSSHFKSYAVEWLAISFPTEKEEEGKKNIHK